MITSASAYMVWSVLIDGTTTDQLDCVIDNHQLTQLRLIFPSYRGSSSKSSFQISPSYGRSTDICKSPVCSPAVDKQIHTDALASDWLLQCPYRCARRMSTTGWQTLCHFVKQSRVTRSYTCLDTRTQHA